MITQTKQKSNIQVGEMYNIFGGLSYQMDMIFIGNEGMLRSSLRFAKKTAKGIETLVIKKEDIQSADSSIISSSRVYLPVASIIKSPNEKLYERCLSIINSSGEEETR